MTIFKLLMFKKELYECARKRDVLFSTKSNAKRGWKENYKKDFMQTLGYADRAFVKIIEIELDTDEILSATTLWEGYSQRMVDFLNRKADELEERYDNKEVAADYRVQAEEMKEHLIN